MGKINVKKWKKLSQYHFGELECLRNAINNENVTVLTLSEGYWKTGTWIPFDIELNKPIELKVIIDELQARFKDTDPHFRIADS